jgi:hypothetical protein
MSSTDRTFDPTWHDEFSHDIILSSLMLYPNSGQERSKYVLKAFLEAAAINEAHDLAKHPEYRDEICSRIGTWLGGNLARLGGWQQLADLLLKSRQPEFHENFAIRMRSGVVAGWIMDVALMEKCSIQKAAILYCEVYQEKGERDELLGQMPKSLTFDLSEENITSNIWGEFQDVAHLWAALQHFQDSGTPSARFRPFFKFGDLAMAKPYNRETNQWAVRIRGIPSP